MFRHDIHGPAEQPGQFFCQGDALSEEIVPSWKFDEEIDVTAIVLFTAGNGAEHADMPRSESRSERFNGVAMDAQLFEQHA